MPITYRHVARHKIYKLDSTATIVDGEAKKQTIEYDIQFNENEESRQVTGTSVYQVETDSEGKTHPLSWEIKAGNEQTIKVADDE